MITAAPDARDEAPHFVFSGDCAGSDLQSFHEVLTQGYRAGRITLDGARIVLSAPITLEAGTVQIQGINAPTIDATGLASGTAVTIVPRNGAPWSALDMFAPLSGVQIVGPGDGVPVDGVFLGRIGTQGELSGGAMRAVKVRGFRDGLVIGDQVWCQSLYDFDLSRCWRYGINYQAAINSGENISLHGGRIYDCHNATGDAVAVYMADSDGGNNELFLYGTSLDYNDIHFDVRAGILSIDGHIEDRSANLIGRVSHPGNGDTVCGAWIRGWITPTEDSPGRARFFEVSGTRAFLRVEAKFSAYNKATQVVDVPSGTPAVSLAGSVFDYSGPPFPRFGAYLNRLHNPAFASLDGWATSGAGYTFGASGGAVQVTSTGAANGSIQQMVPCEPGQTTIVRCKLAVAARSAGYVVVQTRYYAGNPTSLTLPLIKQVDVQQFADVATVTDAVQNASRQVAPPGTKWAAINVQGMGFTGAYSVSDPEMVVV